MMIIMSISTMGRGSPDTVDILECGRELVGGWA